MLFKFSRKKQVNSLVKLDVYDVNNFQGAKVSATTLMAVLSPTTVSQRKDGFRLNFYHLLSGFSSHFYQLDSGEKFG
jgi:hypothetical protein